ncbi:MAG: DUF262 domain-containing protein [Pedobacter sp.]|nr:MAG: DUF262 domain-containing protein [Pedobacter sp.]
MNTGKYYLNEIIARTTRVEQFIVPEIQRDYVWQKTDVLDLMETIQSGFEDEAENTPYLGFIYAFEDKDNNSRYVLIDGQQRLTTIFLLLLALHQTMGKKIPDYLLLKRKNKLKLDYKVREATHDFLFSLVSHMYDYPEETDFVIQDQAWYYTDYENDTTISNLINNLAAIKIWLKSFPSDNLEDFLAFVLDKVELSYFNIEDGRDGEDLYIYMNSRGRPLEPNETLKASFLNNQAESDKLVWGRQWEVWQDFFWKHRTGTADADPGFNEFLRMVQIITLCKKGKGSMAAAFANTQENKIDFNFMPDAMEELEAYFKALQWLTDDPEVKSYFDSQEGEYFLKKAIGRKQIEYFRLLPVLALVAFMPEAERSAETITRFARYFYNVSRKENIGKDIASHLPAAINLMLEYSVSKTAGFDVCDLVNYQKGRTVLINDEEVSKLNLISNPPTGTSRTELEDLFWQAEDHRIFNGEIEFLLDAACNNEKEIFSPESFRSFHATFFTLFPSEPGTHYPKIITALLYFGFTWVRDSPNYYYNYDAADFTYMVKDEKMSLCLRALLKEMLHQPAGYLDTIIRRRIKNFFVNRELISVEALKESNTFFEQVKILCALDYFSDQIFWKWSKYYIAHDQRFSNEFYQGKPFFNQDKLIYNVRRYVDHGWGGRVLNEMKDVLQDPAKLNFTLTNILAYSEGSNPAKTEAEQTVAE